MSHDELGSVCHNVKVHFYSVSQLTNHITPLPLHLPSSILYLLREIGKYLDGNDTLSFHQFKSVHIPPIKALLQQQVTHLQ